MQDSSEILHASPVPSTWLQSNLFSVKLSSVVSLNLVKKFNKIQSAIFKHKINISKNMSIDIINPLGATDFLADTWVNKLKLKQFFWFLLQLHLICFNDK